MPLPSYVINHGVLSEVKLKKLLKEAKVGDTRINLMYKTMVVVNGRLRKAPAGI